MNELTKCTLKYSYQLWMKIIGAYPLRYIRLTCDLFTSQSHTIIQMSMYSLRRWMPCANHWTVSSKIYRWFQGFQAPIYASLHPSSVHHFPLAALRIFLYASPIFFLLLFFPRLSLHLLLLLIKYFPLPPLLMLLLSLYYYHDLLGLSPIRNFHKVASRWLILFAYKIDWTYNLLIDSLVKIHYCWDH